MKKIFLTISCGLLAITCFSQNVGIGTNTPNSNAALEIKSNNKGLLMPRTSDATKNSMANVPKGMLLYDSTNSGFYYHDGYKWRHIGEKNFDGVLTDYSNNPVVTVNMSSSSSTTALSGILYDNGGPAGNYAANSNNLYTVNRSATATDSVVGFKVIIEEMNLESPYDSIEIYSDNEHKTVITGTTTGTYYFSGSGVLFFRFRSNAVNQLSGFKIVWSVLVPSNTIIEEPPLYGWYFNTRKLAMRGGLRNANEWSTDSLGKFSFAYGFDAKASGYSSLSFMSGKATGDYSVAIGGGTYATGNYSFSLGYGGFIPNWADGEGSIVMGGGNIANSDNSIAIGYLSGTSGEHAVAIGESNHAWAIRSVAMGSNNSAYGNYSLALGSYTNAEGYHSTAMGYQTTASGDTSFASGYKTVASGNTSTAMGYQTTASGVRSTSMGQNTTASGSYATSMGYETVSRGFGGTVIGMYNEPILGTAQGNPTTNTPLFIIGNGSSGANSNAMVVLKNGNVGIGTDVPAAGLHVKHAAGGGLVLENANDNTKWRIYSASSDNNLTFYNNAGTEIADIDDVTGTFNALSDSRYKKDIQSINSVLPLVMKLKPKYYHFNWQQQNEERQIGLLAQEAYRLFPELVSYNKEKDLYKMNYAGFSTVAIKAIQEQQVVIQNQQQQIDELRLLVNQLIKSK